MEWPARRLKRRTHYPKTRYHPTPRDDLDITAFVQILCADAEGALLRLEPAERCSVGVVQITEASPPLFPLASYILAYGRTTLLKTDDFAGYMPRAIVTVA
jgi:hypothetical protein